MFHLRACGENKTITCVVSLFISNSCFSLHFHSLVSLSSLTNIFSISFSRSTWQSLTYKPSQPNNLCIYIYVCVCISFISCMLFYKLLNVTVVILISWCLDMQYGCYCGFWFFFVVVYGQTLGSFQNPVRSMRLAPCSRFSFSVTCERLKYI